MAKKTLDPPFTTEDIDGLNKTLTFLLAGLTGAVQEFDLLGISLQRVYDGSFRVIVRGWPREGDNAGIRVVAFTNAATPTECLLYAEAGFRDSTARWHIDRFADNNAADGASKPEPKQLTLV